VSGAFLYVYEGDLSFKNGIEGVVKELHASSNFTWFFMEHMEQFHHLVSLIVRNK